MNRRGLLKAGAGLGALVGAGAVGRYAVLSPPTAERLESVDALAVQVFEGLSEEARSKACVPYYDPVRQYYNRGLWIGGLLVHAASVDWNTRRALTDLLHAGLSDIGRARVPRQFSIRWPGVNGMNVLICGDPRMPPYQVVLSGVHLNLRLGGRSAEGAAFGGTQVYGDQRGDGRIGLPGSMYQYQMHAAHRLFASLTPSQRAAARVEYAPAQTLVGVRDGSVASMGCPSQISAPACRKLAGELIGENIANYAEDDAAYARECLERNGGVDALHLADYDVDFQGGRRAGEGQSQIFRLEGPAAVFHFRGEPHVHAFLNVEMDGEHPLSLGELLGENPAVLEGEALKAYFQKAMREQAQADAAYYPAWSVVGRLRAGPVRTGDVWVAESWVDELVVTEAKGADLAPELVESLRAVGVAPRPRSTYRVATPKYVAAEDRERFDSAKRRRSLGLLRDAVAAHARTNGFGI